MKAELKMIKVREKKEDDVIDGTFTSELLEAELYAEKHDIVTFKIGAKEFKLEVV